MAIKKTSKEEILKESIKLFKNKGYYNTTMANIADSCGLIKGSIYHYFKSKDEIGLESLKFISNYFGENIFSIAYKSDITPKQKIEFFTKKVDDYFLNSIGGCLFGNLALELSNENVIFKDEIRKYFLSWENALVYILKDKYEENEARNLSKDFVASIQGEIMMMNLFDSTENYLKIGKKIISLI